MTEIKSHWSLEGKFYGSISGMRAKIGQIVRTGFGTEFKTLIHSTQQSCIEMFLW